MSWSSCSSSLSTVTLRFVRLRGRRPHETDPGPRRCLPHARPDRGRRARSVRLSAHPVHQATHRDRGPGAADPGLQLGRRCRRTTARSSSQGMLTFIGNSIIVVGIATIIGLVIGDPAAYAFSRLRFRGRDTWASTILSFRFMPPIAVAIPLFLMIAVRRTPELLPGLILPYVAFTLPLVGLDHDRLLRRDAARDRRRGDGRRLQPHRDAVAGHAAARAPRAHRRGHLRRDLHLERVPRRALRHQLARACRRSRSEPRPWSAPSGRSTGTSPPPSASSPSSPS